MHLVFVAQGSTGSAAPQTPNQASSAQLPGAPGLEDNGMAQTALRFGGGLVLGLVLLACGKPSFADVEDVVIPVSQLKQIKLSRGCMHCILLIDCSRCGPDPAASKLGWQLLTEMYLTHVAHYLRDTLFGHPRSTTRARPPP